MAKTLFISYSHKDEKYKEYVADYLAVAEKQGLLEVWDDRRIKGGEDWRREIEKALAEAKVAILLVSPHFLTSDFILNEEVSAMLHRRDQEGLIIYPVIIRACDWEAVGWLEAMNLRPRGGKPLARIARAKRDEVMAGLSKEIRGFLNDDVETTIEPEALASEDEVESGFQKIPNVLTNTLNVIEVAYHKKSRITGVPTGLDAMDERLGGLQPSDLVILAARPGMGKTALALNISSYAAASKAMKASQCTLRSNNNAVGIFSLDISAEKLGMRLLSAEARIGGDELRRGRLEDDDFRLIVQASQSIASRPIFIDDTPALSVATLSIRARRLMDQHGLSLIVVDYLQLLRPVTTAGQGNRGQEISEITQGLKAIAKELNIPVLALSQLSHAVEQREDKRPGLSDLRESGSIEMHADVVMFIHRDEYYLARTEPKFRPGQNDEQFNEEYAHWVKRLQEAHNVADIIIAKQKYGPIGTFQLIFNGEYSEFCDMEYRENLDI